VINDSTIPQGSKVARGGGRKGKKPGAIGTVRGDITPIKTSRQQQGEGRGSPWKIPEKESKRGETLKKAARSLKKHSHAGQPWGGVLAKRELG